MCDADRSAAVGEAMSATGDAYRHIYHLHAGGRGFVALCSKPGIDGHAMETRCYEGSPLFQALAQLDGREHFVTINSFVRPRRRIDELFGLRACFVDLDYHRLPVWADAAPEAVWAALRRTLADHNLPDPTLVVASGRGMHAYWRFPSGLPKEALPRWRAVQQYFCEKLTGFGADPNAKDAARILRIAGTFNPKAGKAASIVHLDPDRHVDFEDLARAVLPLTQHQLQELRRSRAEASSDRAADGAPVRRKSNAQDFVDAILADIDRLVAHRWGNEIPEGHRNTTLFVRGSFMLRRVGAHAIEARLFEYGRRICDLPEEELALIAGSIVKKLLLDGRGYRYGSAGAAAALGVTIDEVRAAGLVRLHPADPELAEVRRQARLKRDRERKEAQRRAAGVRPRSESLARLRPWEALGISERTWYRRGKPTSSR